MALCKRRMLACAPAATKERSAVKSASSGLLEGRQGIPAPKDMRDETPMPPGPPVCNLTSTQ